MNTYYSQPSRRALRVCRIDFIGYYTFYGKVYNTYTTLVSA